MFAINHLLLERRKRISISGMPFRSCGFFNGLSPAGGDAAQHIAAEHPK
jgi:hypothetical protein